MGVRKKKKGKSYKASDKQTYQVTEMVNVTTNRVGEITSSEGDGLTIYGHKRGKSRKEAAQQYRATKKAAKQRKKAHKKARKKK